MASASESDFRALTDSSSIASSSEYFRPTSLTPIGREVVFASAQNVVMGTHPDIPNLIIIGNLGRDLPEEFVVPALSHEEIHNTLNKLGVGEKHASVSFLDRIGKAVTELDVSGLALEGIMEESFRQYRVKKVLNRTNV